MKLSRRSKKAEPVLAKLQLTSLVDVLTILLVFLIKSFSEDPISINVPKEIELAEATVQNSFSQELELYISPNNIFLEQKNIISTEKANSLVTLEIPALYTLLKKIKRESIFPNSKKGYLNIQCDKNIPFKVLKKVLYTSKKAGFSKYSLLVLTK